MGPAKSSNRLALELIGHDVKGVESHWLKRARIFPLEAGAEMTPTLAEL